MSSLTTKEVAEHLGLPTSVAATYLSRWGLGRDRSRGSGHRIEWTPRDATVAAALYEWGQANGGSGSGGGPVRQGIIKALTTIKRVPREFIIELGPRIKIHMRTVPHPLDLDEGWSYQVPLVSLDVRGTGHNDPTDTKEA